MTVCKRPDGRVDWPKTLETLPPGLTVPEVAKATGTYYQAAYESGVRYGYKFKKRPYSKRRNFRPERDTPEYTALRSKGLDVMDAINAVQSQIEGREGAIDKARRMVDAGHPPGVAAIYTGLTRAEVYQIIGEAAQ